VTLGNVNDDAILIIAFVDVGNKLALNDICFDGTILLYTLKNASSKLFVTNPLTLILVH